MKSIIVTGIAIISCLLLHNTIQAQTLVPPTLTDIPWAPASPSGINTALIDLLDLDSDNPNHPYKELGACAYDGGGGGVVVTDFRSGWQVNVTYPVTGGPGTVMTSVPDVILGNKLGSNIDFIMAVAFVNNFSQVEVDYFDIHYTSHTVFTVTYHSNSTFLPPSGYLFLKTVHIDVVARSSAPMPFPYSLPTCNTFFVTYDVGNVPAYLPDEVYAAYGNLNGYAITAGPQLINLLGTCTGFAQEAREPDVAGVERETSPGSGIFNDVACFTYILGKGMSGYSACTGLTHSPFVFYSEWDPSLAACGTPSGLSNYVWLAGSAAFTTCHEPDYAHPRIDANDDYTTNGSSPMCQSKVVCEYTDYSTPLPPVIQVYGPTLSYGLGGTTSSSWINFTILPPFYPPSGPGYYYHHSYPSVAYGSNFGSEYMVSECTILPGYGDFFVMSPVDQPCTAGLSMAPGGSYDYFVVNSSYPAASSNYANAVSTPCNRVSDTSLVAWTNGGQIYYKRSGFGGTNGYAYKPAPSGIPDYNRNETVHIAPNPADQYITINSASSAADYYRITNALGQAVLGGAMTGGSTRVDISMLPAGNYFVRCSKNNMPAGNRVFIKK